jgi:hypothetical protein
MPTSRSYTENSPQSLRKGISIGIASEYRPPLNAPHHDLVEGTSGVDSKSPWHNLPLPLSNLLCKPKNPNVSLCPFGRAGT